MRAGVPAGIAFGIVDLPAGFLVSQLLAGSPPGLVNALLWGLIGLAAGFFVYSSEAPRRPLPLGQAVVADGVVTGISAGFAGLILDLVIASRLGGTGGVSISFLGGAGEVLLAGAVGGIVGAAIGGVILNLAGRDRLERTPEGRPSSKRSRGGSRPSRKRR